MNKAPYLGIEWRHPDLCRNTSEACHISFLNDNTVAYSKKQDILQSGISCSGIEECYWDCCFDIFDEYIYLLGKNKVIETQILICNKSSKRLSRQSSINVSHHDINSPCYITTSKDYIFITAGKTPQLILRILKNKRNNYFSLSGAECHKKLLDDVTIDKSVVLGEYLFTTCVDAKLLYKFRIKDLEKEMDITLTGKIGNSANVDFSNAIDIRSDNTLLYILFNSQSLKSICAFNDNGILINVIVTNPRRLQNPTSFCLDKDCNIIVADTNTIKVFNHYGRPIHTIECAKLQSLKYIEYNCVDNQIIVLAQFNEKNLHIY